MRNEIIRIDCVKKKLKKIAVVKGNMWNVDSGYAHRQNDPKKI